MKKIFAGIAVFMLSASVGITAFAAEILDRDYIEDFDFNDDDNGNWTIDTEDNSYSFYILNGMWQMVDENGDSRNWSCRIFYIEKEKVRDYYDC
jgi:hypothetical protein